MELVPRNGTSLDLYHDSFFGIEGNLTMRDAIVFRQKYAETDPWEMVNDGANLTQTYMMPGTHDAQLSASSKLGHAEVSLLHSFKDEIDTKNNMHAYLSCCAQKWFQRYIAVSI